MPVLEKLKEVPAATGSTKQWIETDHEDSARQNQPIPSEQPSYPSVGAIILEDKIQVHPEQTLHEIVNLQISEDREVEV